MNKIVQKHTLGNNNLQGVSIVCKKKHTLCTHLEGSSKEKTMTKYYYRDGSEITKKIFEKDGKLKTIANCNRCEGTGKTFWKWVEGGVCFKCGGTGEYGYARVYTQEQVTKLEKARLRRIDTIRRKQRLENTLIVSGLSFVHNPKKFSRNKFLVSDWKKFQIKSINYYKRGLEILESKSSNFWIKLKADFVELGKHTKQLTLIFKHSFETQFGFSEIHKFIDDQNNQYVWFTSSYPNLEKGKTYNAKFIVKDNQESNEYGKQNMIKNFKEVK